MDLAIMAQLSVAAMALVYVVFACFPDWKPETGQKTAIATLSCLVLLIATSFLWDAWPAPTERIAQILVMLLGAKVAKDTVSRIEG